MSSSNKLNILSESENCEQTLKSSFPSWLRMKLPKGSSLWKTDKTVENAHIQTVCHHAKCPNRFECFNNKTATFLALGKQCTRSCGFCSIDFNKTPMPPDPKEPEEIAKAVKELGLKHVVITMVARDDLEDGGSNHLVSIVEKIRLEHPICTIELLTSDFDGNVNAWQRILNVKPDVFNHNIETTRAHSPKIRHKATYDRTLELLAYVNEHRPSAPFYLKSGIMVGLGETSNEIFSTLQDLKAVGCDIVTIGQYLKPTRKHVTIKEIISPETFQEYEKYGHTLGIKHMYCGPFVRSSYNAHLFL